MTSLQDGVYIANVERPGYVWRVDTAARKAYEIRADGSERPVGLWCFDVADGYKVVAKPETPKPHKVPGTLLRSPRSGNVIRVIDGNYQRYVEISNPRSCIYRRGDLVTMDVAPPLSEWQVVKPVIKTEYVPV